MKITAEQITELHQSENHKELIEKWWPETLISDPKDSLQLECFYWVKKNDEWGIIYVSKDSTLKSKEGLISYESLQELDPNPIQRNERGFTPDDEFKSLFLGMYLALKKQSNRHPEDFKFVDETALLNRMEKVKLQFSGKINVSSSSSPNQKN